MRAIEVRQSLSRVLLSTLPPKERELIEQELRLVIQAKEEELGFSLEPPDGRFVTKNRDTLVMFSGQHIVSALLIEVTARLENVIIATGIEAPEVVLQATVTTGEGILLSAGHSSYDYVAREEFDPAWHKRISGGPMVEELYAGQPVKIYRRLL